MIATRWASSTTFHASPFRGLIVHQGGRMPPTPHLMVWAETGTHTSVSTLTYTWFPPECHDCCRTRRRRPWCCWAHWQSLGLWLGTDWSANGSHNWVFAEKLAGWEVFLWSGLGDNPYQTRWVNDIQWSHVHPWFPLFVVKTCIWWLKWSWRSVGIEGPVLNIPETW